jgi:hypothetical protein
MLVAIDTRVQAYQSLATGVCSGAKVIIIEQDGDAIAQITAALSEYPSDSLHIVCHGEPGTLYLGKTPINWSNLEQYRHQLQKWQVTDILLYACSVAADLTPAIPLPSPFQRGTGGGSQGGQVSCTASTNSQVRTSPQEQTESGTPFKAETGI